MPHIDLGVYYVSHPDFHTHWHVGQPKRKGSVWNTICWLLVIVLIPFDIIAIAAMIFAVRGN